MNVKISVKKLHRMEKMWKQRCESDRRRYGREVRGWEHENEQLRESNKAYREKVKALRVLHEKEIKLLEQRNDALDKQWHQQEMQINGLVDENDDLKVKVAMMEESLSLLQGGPE